MHVRLLSLPLAVASLAVLLASANGQSFITNGLVAYYPFNGNANDASGNGNNGTAVGATLTADRFGNTNSAYRFNGLSDYIGFFTIPTSQVDNWTMSAWLKPASLNQLGAAVALGYNDLVSGNGHSLAISSGSGGATGSNLFGLYGGVSWVNSGFSFGDTNQWYHVLMLRNSGLTTFYVNGHQTPNTTTFSPSIPTSFRIGSANGNWFFNGAIDDVRIYNRAFSSNEVSALYSMESGVCSPHAASATAQIINGFVVGATMTDNGCGYTNAPLVLISGGGGSNATATATIQSGVVTSINIINTGSGYTNPPDILIGSPPFVPTLSISVSRISVTQHVVLGLKYVLESSFDLINWTPTGPPFIAQSEEISTEFVVAQTGQFFRLLEVP